MNGARRWRRRLSKWLAWGLRHDPAGAGFTVDEAGWADVAAVVAAAERAGFLVDAEGLRALVQADPKGRYTLRRGRIRANHGHTIPVRLGIAPSQPPPRLYHGTVQQALPGIRRDGLRSGARRHVHLSADLATARKVGERRGHPVVLEIGLYATKWGRRPLSRAAG